MTTTTTRQPEGGRLSRRVQRLLAVLAALLVILAGYAAWANTQPYTLQASTQSRSTKVTCTPTPSPSSAP